MLLLLFNSSQYKTISVSPPSTLFCPLSVLINTINTARRSCIFILDTRRDVPQRSSRPWPRTRSRPRNRFGRRTNQHLRTAIKDDQTSGRARGGLRLVWLLEPSRKSKQTFHLTEGRAVPSKHRVDCGVLCMRRFPNLSRTSAPVFALSTRGCIISILKTLNDIHEPTLSIHLSPPHQAGQPTQECVYVRSKSKADRSKHEKGLSAGLTCSYAPAGSSHSSA